MKALPVLLILLIVFGCENKKLEFSGAGENALPVNYEFIGIDVSEGIPTGLDEGDLAPEFSGIDQNNEIFSLEEALKEKKVLLMFIQGLWNPHLMRMMIHMNDTVPDILEAGALPVVITSMTDPIVKAFAGYLEMQYTTISDTSNRISNKYKGDYFSTTSFVDRMLLEENIRVPAGIDGRAKLNLTAVYLIEQTGEISWTYKTIDPAFRPRFNYILENIKGQSRNLNETSR